MTNVPDARKLIPALKTKYEAVVVACNRCGFCTSFCPTYNYSGSESHSPRGRNQIFRSILNGKLKDPIGAKDIIDTCLMCGECTTVCFAEIPTAQLMIYARELLNRSQGMSFWLRLFVDVLLPHPKLLYWALKFSILGKKLGISWLLRKTGILKRVAPGLDAADIVLKKTSLRFLPDLKESKRHLEKVFVKKDSEFFDAQQKVARLAQQGKGIPDGLKKLAAKRPERPKVALLPVCGSQYLRSSIAAASIKILEKLKIDFIIPETTCCGLPAASYGVVDQVKRIALKNIRRLEHGHFEAILTDDSSCTAHFKDYPEFFQDEPIIFEKAHTMSQKVREFSSFLIQFGILDLLKKTKWSGEPVAYHDPCKAQYGQKITQPPRQILSAIPGLKLVPVAEADQCCGGGGTYCFIHPELSQGVLSAKIKNIAASGCQVVVTSAASCLSQIEFGLREKHLPIKAMHFSEFIAKLL